MDFYNEIKEDVSDIRNEFGYANDGIAFGHYCVKECFKHLDIEDLNIKDYIVDGANDLGLDAIIIQEEDRVINLFQFKYSSNNPNLKEKDIEKAFNIVEYILHTTNFDPNNKIKSKIDNLIDAYTRDELLDWDINFYFIDRIINDNLYIKYEHSLLEYKDKYKTNSSNNIQFEFVDYDNLIERRDQKIIPKSIFKINLKNKPLENSYKYLIDGKSITINQIFFLIGLGEIKKIYKEKGKSIFEFNVRYGGKKTKINNEILEELKKGEDSNFSIKNNGITATCENFNLDENNILNINNMQIINGAQTTTVISKLNDEEINKLKDEYCFFRLLKIDSNKDYNQYVRISEEISISSNKQNSVRDRDLYSNDKRQLYFTRIFKENFNIGFIKKDGEKPNMKNSIANKSLGTSYLSFFDYIPTTHIGKTKFLFGDEAAYKRVFKEEKNQAYKLLFSYRLHKIIDGICKKQIVDLNNSTIKDYFGFMINVVSPNDYLLAFSGIYFIYDCNGITDLKEKLDNYDFTNYFDKDFNLDIEKLDLKKFSKFIYKLARVLDRIIANNSSNLGPSKLRFTDSGILAELAVKVFEAKEDLRDVDI